MDLYVLVFMHLESREVIATPCTQHPNSQWVSEQATEFIAWTKNREHVPTLLIHDRDTKFDAAFKDTLSSSGIKTKRLPKRSPNLNARVERFVQTIKTECLDRFIAFGHDHLNYLVEEFVDHYNASRPHSHKNHRPPCDQDPVPEWETISLDEVVCEERLGGVIKTMRHRAA